MAVTPSSVDVTPSGSTPIATFSVDEGAGTVYIQQYAVVDPGTGQGAPVTANGLQVVPFAGAPKTSGLVTSAPIAAGGSANLDSTAITNAKTATLQHGIFAATQPTLWTLESLDDTPTTTIIAAFVTAANETFDFKPGTMNEISSALSAGAAKFRVVAQNLNANVNQTSTAYATFFWAEN